MKIRNEGEKKLASLTKESWLIALLLAIFLGGLAFVQDAECRDHETRVQLRLVQAASMTLGGCALVLVISFAYLTGTRRFYNLCLRIPGIFRLIGLPGRLLERHCLSILERKDVAILYGSLQAQDINEDTQPSSGTLRR